ncbi:DUF6503 family protein [Candidatus Palauibacter sp.]|uniref:DUF6503 family protein n=1 Tax=Candidatus Palauibacter sp. TaxID=3101350 RepID=UPI003B015078
MYRCVFVLPPLLLGAACGEAGPPRDDGGPDGAAEDAARTERTPAHALVARSVAFHDPDGIWGSEAISMSWVGTDGEGGERVAVSLRFGADERDFALSGRYRGSEIEYETTADGWSASVNGVAEPDLAAADRENMRLHREDGMFWRSYYGFLAGLPMKIADPGAHLEPDIIDTTFMDRTVQAVKVTYEADVGADTWYFYFDPVTAQLAGCRFYHDESANDGEYITFEGLSDGGGLRLPRVRAWYVNADGRHLGTDTVEEILVGP